MTSRNLTPNITPQMELALAMEFLKDKLQGKFGPLGFIESIIIMKNLDMLRVQWFTYSDEQRARASLALRPSGLDKKENA